MRAVILQPMYLPWIGYFGMIDRADTFVYYDDVQFVRRSWQRRNKIKVPGGDFTWLTVPVEKDFGQEIREVEIKDNGWRDKHWKSIHHSYANAPYFDEYSPLLKDIYESECVSLLSLNITIIENITDSLGIDDTEFVYSSKLNVEGEKTDRLLSVLNEIGADEYISGPAAKDYIEIEKFKREGIDLYWHDFDHPEYPQQHGEFVSHLSAIDLLFNVGEDAMNVIRKGEEGGLEEEY
jgi:hypothetical protein